MSINNLTTVWDELEHRTCELQEEITSCEHRIDSNNQMVQRQMNTLADAVLSINELLNETIQRIEQSADDKERKSVA